MLFIACEGNIEPNGGGNNNNTEEPEPEPEEEENEYKIATPTPKEWDGVKRGNITYQLLVYSFADSDNNKMGDFNGITDKLSYIDELGASAIWLSPIHPADSYHGYDVTNYSEVSPDYGSMSDFTNLVSSAKSKEIGIYLDYVLNHTGKGHSWFTEACKSTTSDYRDYYIFSTDPKSDIQSGKIAMITDNTYNENEWFTAPTDASLAEPAKIYKFTLNWSSSTSPTITVTEATTVDVINPDESTQDAKYLYYGDEGECVKFYSKGNNIYELTVSYESSWGFLIRTSNTTWDGGTKYGSSNAESRVSIGVPFTLTNSSPQNIVMSGTNIYKFHSNFYTDWMPDINYGSISTFKESKPYKELVESAKGWIDRGVAGFRLDAVKHIYHNSYSSENPTFLKGFYEDLNSYYKAANGEELYMVGEVLDGATNVAPYYAGLPALFEFDFWYRLEYAICNNVGRYFVKDILSYQELYKGVNANYIEATKLSNHDEDRTSSKLNKDINRCKLAAAVLLTASGQPYIYYGEEIGIYGTKESDDQYVRSRMLWGDSYTTDYTNGNNIDATMESNVESVSIQSTDESSLLNVYKEFGKARNTYNALAIGDMVKHSTFNETNGDYNSIAAWYRVYDSEKVLVLHNFSANTIELTLPATDKVKSTIVTLNNVYLKDEDQSKKIKMSGYSSIVLELE